MVVIQLLFVDSILLTVISLGQAAVAPVLDDLYPLLIFDLDLFPSMIASSLI